MNTQKAILYGGLIILTGIVYYFSSPKYDVYVSAGDGTVVYRFNKITGEFNSIDKMIFSVKKPGTYER